ncbi:excinuclease ABC subunit UvrB [Candidatus Berkelbacteria bacterium]|nr:excinuclease ABC subunit UvrB [Candidatus Berkelbacteria bacterium]
MDPPATLHLSSSYSPAGDQPQAIQALCDGLERGVKEQTLLGVTGSGKTFTVANVLDRVQRPALVIAHNKTLAAQLAAEFRSFFPQNAVEYFVSYYDYYQPEAYDPSSDTYIEKEAEINDEIDRLRHAATAAVLARDDVIVVASVSAIYGLGSPDMYRASLLELSLGQTHDRGTLISQLVEMYYARGATFERGTFAARGGTIDIVPTNEERIYRLRLDGDCLAAIEILDLVTRAVLESPPRLMIFPAKHFVVSPEQLRGALVSIEHELAEQLAALRTRGKLTEAERLERRTRHDIALMREVGYCNGIENYSRHLTGRAPGDAPDTLLDYFPKHFVTVIDESHVTLSQIGGMFAGDRARKETLIEYGFRLPSALDNRPLTFQEFEARTPQRLYISATPGPYERRRSGQLVEQIIRPTGLVDPETVIRPITNQVKDALTEIETVVQRGDRVLVTTLTKKMAEDLAEHLAQAGVSTTYLHSEVETLERIRTLDRLRRGDIDVLVGVNLIREGLDLPEVALVLILDADKEGFLRSETSLVQTIGRAARHVRGRVVLYADTITGSMQRALTETDRRRAKQVAYNTAHQITPQSIKKERKSILADDESAPAQELLRPLNPDDLPKLIKEQEGKMKTLARELRFEEASLVRDEVIELRKLARTLNQR